MIILIPGRASVLPALHKIIGVQNIVQCWTRSYARQGLHVLIWMVGWAVFGACRIIEEEVGSTRSTL